jgi:hypothetical protein
MSTPRNYSGFQKFIRFFIRDEAPEYGGLQKGWLK